MSAQLVRFRQDVTSTYNDWERFVILPYHLAYDFAFSNFKKTLDEQAKLDQLKTELAMAGVAIAGGSLLTGAFGTALLSGTASKLTMNTIYRFELNKAFNVAHAISSSPSTQFALTSIADKVITGRIGEMAKAAVGKEMKQRTNVVANTPGAVKSKMQLFARDARAKVEALAVNIWSDVGKVCFTGTRKIQLLDDLKTTAYFQPPSRPISPGTGTFGKPSDLARRLELTFYLTMVADSDYFISHPETYRPAGSPGPKTKPDNGALDTKPRANASLGRSILVSPDDPRYPTATRSGQGVLIDDVGVAVANRMNDLYKQETSVSNGKAFFDNVNWLLDEPVTKSHLKKAYIALKKIGPLSRDHVSSL